MERRGLRWRFGTMKLNDVQADPSYGGRQQIGVGIHEQANLAHMIRHARASASACSALTLRGLFEKNTKPTWLAPARTAASTASGVERPQILASTGMAPIWAGSNENSSLFAISISTQT